MFPQLDETNRAKLTDVGLWRRENLAKQQYDKTIDVYAFGMLLWRVCEGKGNQPQNVNGHFLVLNAPENKTPERLDVFPQSCWELMEKCWNEVPEERLSFDSVVKDLEKILRDVSIR